MPDSPAPSWRRRAATAAAALVLLGLGVPAAAQAGAAEDGGRDDQGTPGAVVVIGMTGVRWDDVSTVATPGLARLGEQFSVGNAVVRSVRPSACPVDGWLALGAGKRSADLPGEGFGQCRRLVEPSVDGEVRGWDDYVASRDAGAYGAELGLLGSMATAAGVEAVSIGPGAAVALADPSGQVAGTHLRRPLDADELGRVVGLAASSAGLVVVDVGEVRDPGRATVHVADGTEQASGGSGFPPLPEDMLGGPGITLGPEEAITTPTRGEQVEVLDARVRAVLEALAEAGPSVVVVASIADSGTAPRLQLLATDGVGSLDGSGVLTSMATRQDGYVQATDLLPTVLRALGLWAEAPAGALVGAPAFVVPGAETGTERVSAMVDLDRHSVAVRWVTPAFFSWLIVVNLVLYGCVALAMFRPLRRPRAALYAFRVGAVAVAALPVSSYLANLVPWWRVQTPAVGLYSTVAVFIAVITALALAPRWRRWLLGPLGVVATVTAVVICADVLTGSTLQLASPMGVHPLVAGRFYGLNNSAFALLLVSSLLASAAAADALVRRGRRVLAVWLVAVAGVLVTVVDGMPGLGSDFGGPPALVPAFAVLALSVAGVRLNWRRVLAVVAAGVLAVTVFGIADWLRPPEQRTHLGGFVQTVIDGGLWDVIVRKLGQNLTILTGSWLVLLAIAGIALVVWVLGRPWRWALGTETSALGGTDVLRAIGGEAPTLRPAIGAITLGLAIGFAVNDSGIVIPAIGISHGVPLLIAASATWLLQHVRELPTPAAEVDPSVAK